MIVHKHMQGKYWKMLVDMQLDEGNMQSAVATFGLCLTNCYTVELWKAYMRYIYTVCWQLYTAYPTLFLPQSSFVSN
jgi:hypothetical protein